jgi:hypothetical protein
MSTQFFHQQHSHRPSLNLDQSSQLPRLDFATLEDETSGDMKICKDDELLITEGRMSTATENGIIVRKSAQPSWKCSIPGSMASLAWPSM